MFGLCRAQWTKAESLKKETGCVAHRWPHTLSVCLRYSLKGLYKAELDVCCEEEVHPLPAALGRLYPCSIFSMKYGA